MPQMKIMYLTQTPSNTMSIYLVASLNQRVHFLSLQSPKALIRGPWLACCWDFDVSELREEAANKCITLLKQ